MLIIQLRQYLKTDLQSDIQLKAVQMKHQERKSTCGCYGDLHHHKPIT